MHALRREVRAFAAEAREAGLLHEQIDGWFFGFSREFSTAMAERGWLGMTWPSRYGGGERSAHERFVVLEELLALGAPMNAHWVSDRQTGPSLLRHGTEQQRRHFLPAMARGACVTALGMSEPNAGSDLAAARTRARRVAGGWLLSGTKIWTGNAHRADLLVVLARSDPQAHRSRAFTQFLVELPDLQVTATPVPTVTGLRHFCRVELDEVFVPDAMVLGEVGAGWAQVITELGDERAGPERYLSAFPLAAALAETARASGSREHLREVGLLTARLAGLRALAMQLLDSGDPHPLPRAVRAAAFKAAATEYEADLIDTARRLLSDGDTASVRARELLATAIALAPAAGLRGGTTQIMEGIVARGLA